MLKPISVGDIDLVTEVRGDGLPLLLIHGFPLNHEMWQSQIETLIRDFQVLAPDLRGWGASPRGAAEISMAQIARDLERLTQTLVGERPIAVGGLSMGGYIAFEWIRQFPQRFSHLILADTRAIADDEVTARARMVTAQSIRQNGVAELARDMPVKLLHPVSRETDSEIVGRLVDMIQSADPEVVADYLEAMARRRSSEELLPQIAVPTLVVCGSHDVISTPEEMREIASRIENATFEWIDCAGHLPPMEQPEEFNAAVRRFLTS